MKKYILLLITVVCSSSYAYRDMETGTFLTRDPMGYKDGANLYCYVHCNPITKFDAIGLYSKVTHSRPGIKFGGSSFISVQKTHKVYIEIPVMINNKSGVELSQSQINTAIKATAEAWSGTFGKYEVETNIKVLSYDKQLSPAELKEQKINQLTFTSNDGRAETGFSNGPDRKNIAVEIDSEGRALGTQNAQRTLDHEMGHTTGADHDGIKGSLMADSKLMEDGSIDRARDKNVLPRHISEVLYSRYSDINEVHSLDLDKVREEKAAEQKVAEKEDDDN